MGGTGRWILGGLIGLFGLLGLFLSSRAHDPVMYFVGLLFFAFAVLFDFGLIGRYAGQSKGH